MMTMKRSSFDSSLLSVFRLFVGIRLAISLLFLSLQLEEGGERIYRLERQPLLGIGEALLLLVYLSWPWLRSKLGKAYLPIALGVATFGPVVENYIAIDLQPEDSLFLARVLGGQWELVILVLVPIILISWQYSYPVVVGTTLSLALVDTSQALVISQQVGARLGPMVTVVVFRTLTFLLIGYVIVRLTAEQRKQNAQLAQANRQLINYASTMEQLTVSRERNRLARELHDTLAHSLSAVAVQLEAVNALWDTDPKQSRAMLEHSLTLTRDGLNEARRAIQALRTAPLEDLGLTLALKNMASSMVERAGISLELDLPDDLPNLRPDIEHSVYRITEEAIRNVVQHAEAKKIFLGMRQNQRSLTLTIQDDGRGLNHLSASTDDTSEDHYGLRGMQEWAEAIGARLTIESKLGQGTTVRLSWEIVYDPGINL
jgi:signal transduction histidine kinase